MATPAQRPRIIASYLLMVAIVASVIVQSRHHTAEEGSPGYTMDSDIVTIDVEADSGIYETLPESDDSDPDPQPPPVEKPKDTLFAASNAIDAARPAATKARVNWHVNLASHTAPDIANEMVERIRAAGFDAAHQRVDHNGRQFWRVYVRGFPSRQAATVQAANIATRLGLKDYWISKAS
ncbi:MAG: SPOR domain-containing protein [Gammaproteobacteria bacterium]